MYYTLIELERIHKCPMIVKDAFTGMYFLIIRKDPETSSLYEVKPLREETHRPELGTPTNLIYGGFNRWLFIRKAEPMGISPEEQKKAKEFIRKKTNDSLVKDLKRTSRTGSYDKRAEDKKSPPPKDGGKVIPFRPRKETT